MTTSTEKKTLAGWGGWSRGWKKEQGKDTRVAVNRQAEPEGKQLHLCLICQGFTLVKL